MFQTTVCAGLTARRTKRGEMYDMYITLEHMIAFHMSDASNKNHVFKWIFGFPLKTTHADTFTEQKATWILHDGRMRQTQSQSINK